MRALALLVLAIGCAEPVGERAAPITNGSASTEPAVVFLSGAPRGCTGTLIAPDVVLTAAHCGAQDDPASVRVGNAASRDSGEPTVGLRDAVVHPAYDGSADHDLALLLLEDPLEAEPITLDDTGTLAAPPPVEVRILGYGVTAGGEGDDGVRREGTSRTAEVTAFFVELAASPSLPCNGDSGGAVLVGGRLGGVISRGDAACDTQGKATRIDVHLDELIRPQLEAWAAGEVPGGFGEPCGTRGECLSRECSSAGLCSERCVSGRDECPEGFRCALEGGTDFLCVPESDGGCSAGAPVEPAFVLPMLVALLLLRRRRRMANGAPR